MRYQGSNRARGGAGGPPCSALLQDLPMCWTVVISPWGVGPTGRGNSFPLPCLPRSKYRTSPAAPAPPAPSAKVIRTLLPASPTPPAPCGKGYPYTSPASPTPPAPCGKGYPYTSPASPTPPAPCGKGYPYTSPAAPTPPAPSALLPRPLPGAGSVRGDIRGAAVPGFSPGSPRALDRGDIATGGGADGEGELVPPPLSPTLQIPYFAGPPTPPAPSQGDTYAIRWHPYSAGFSAGVPIHFCRHPPPRPHLVALLPRPLPGGVGSARAYIR